MPAILVSALMNLSRMKNIRDPKDLVALLKEFFPPFEQEWAKAEADDAEQAAYTGYQVELTFHDVLQVFAPLSAELLKAASSKQVSEFCKFINESIVIPGSLENAISTCLLEHASQIGIRKLLLPFLSRMAKKELR